MINAMPLQEQGPTMSNSPLFKRAFVRGLNAELIREGVILYPSKEAADASADYVADNSGMPDPYLEGDVLDIKTAGVLCEYLVKAAEYQCEQAGNRYNPTVTKTAQENTPVAIATADAWDLMEKSAAETGSLVEGGDKPNSEEAAAKDNAEAALDTKERPKGYATLGERGVGNYEHPTEGTVGSADKHPKAPAATGNGTNSVVEKTSSLMDIVRRMNKTGGSTGSLITGGKTPNDLNAAAANNAEAALEQQNRPENYANKGERGVGQTAFAVPEGAVVGREMPHPHKPNATEAGSNTIIQQTKNAFDQLFETTAQQVVPYLPEKMADEVKVAHVRAMLGLEVPERADYLHNLYASLGAEKTAAESVRDHFKKTAMEHKEPDGDECPADAKPALPPAMMAKKEEKEEKEETEEKGEKEASVTTLSSLRARLQGLTA